MVRISGAAAAPVKEPGKATYWEKNVTDVDKEGITKARDIGYVRNNYSRLNVAASLGKGDKEDWYKFSVQTNGKLRFTIRAEDIDKKEGETDEGPQTPEEVADMFRAKGMRVEVYSYNGHKMKLLASNDTEKTKENETFERLIRGEEKVNRGTLYVKVSRIDGKDTDDTLAYAMQLQQGDKQQRDYMTVEREAPKSKTHQTALEKALADADVSMRALSMMNASSMLQSGATNFASIKNKGTAISRIFNLLI